jgi:hypothetical protein
MKNFQPSLGFVRLGSRLAISCFVALSVSSCSESTVSPVLEDKENISVLTGKPGGIKLSDLGKKRQSGDGLPVNALLWRAALDTASFIPLDDVDTFGGTIVTEWHQPKSAPGQRLKLAIFVVGRELRSDAITVRAYVQNRLDDQWIDAGRDEALSRKLENLVLTRARELRAAATAETVN